MRIVTTIAVAALVLGCGDDNGGAGGAGGGDGRLSIMVDWEPLLPCEAGVESNWQISTTISGGVEPFMLEGQVVGCPEDVTSDFTTDEFQVPCPNIGTYSGSVRVTDGTNDTQFVEFTFGDCTPGSGQAP